MTNSDDHFFKPPPDVPPVKDDQTVSELAKAAGTSNGSISRQLSYLSSVNRNGGPGLDLVEQRIYLHDRRFTKNRLTAKGQAVVNRIVGAMGRRQLAVV